jgi:TonB family protein
MTAVKSTIAFVILALLAGLSLSQMAHAVNDDTFVGPPRYVRGPKVVYPETMRQQHAEGRVMLRVLIGADGKAREVRIHRSSGWVDLDNAALQAVRGAQWETIPEPIWCLVPINFVLR